MTFCATKHRRSPTFTMLLEPTLYNVIPDLIEMIALCIQSAVFCWLAMIMCRDLSTNLDFEVTCRRVDPHVGGFYFELLNELLREQLAVSINLLDVDYLLVAAGFPLAVDGQLGKWCSANNVGGVVQSLGGDCGWRRRRASKRAGRLRNLSGSVGVRWGRRRWVWRVGDVGDLCCRRSKTRGERAWL
jgi:hypothetical protein